MAYKRKKSLQAIEDFYYQKGLWGDELRLATQSDREYVQILKKRRMTLRKKFQVKSGDSKKYILSTDQDYIILGKIYELEGRKLSKNDKILIKLIRTQLEHHWRTPILRFLDRLLKKYHKV